MSLDAQLTDYVQQFDAEKRGVKMRLSKDMALKALAEVPDDKVFYMSDGRVLKSLPELSAALESMDMDIFSHHVNSEKNDFANWINGVIGDEKLSAEVAKSKNIAALSMKIRKRIEQMSKKTTGNSVS
jgi:hypothetical protein